MKQANKLTPQQERFVCEYIVDLNATQAAIRAGYSEHTAKSQGNRLLTNVDIQEAVKRKQKKLSEKTEITQAWVLKQLTKVYRRCMQEEPVKDREGNPTGQFTFKENGANRSLELIGKHLSMFVDRNEITGKNGGAIEFAGLSESERNQRLVAILNEGRARRDTLSSDEDTDEDE